MMTHRTLPVLSDWRLACGIKFSIEIILEDNARTVLSASSGLEK
jgi:hypothetical protein